MAPFDLSGLGTGGSAVLFVAIGILFGYVLESSGFGDSRKLAGQFYFTDLAVLKVMFTGIVVAMALIVWSSSVGLLNFDDIWVNSTFVWPGIVGGLVMGVGFVVGGYCPGTSLVSMATLKKDGAMFVVGALLGIFVFGESVDLIEPLMASGEMGRVTLGGALGLSPGVVVVLVVALALGLFFAADLIQQKLHGPATPGRRLGRFTIPTLAGAGLVAAVVPLLFVHEPGYLEKWERMTDKHALVTERKVQIDPAELLATMGDDAVRLELLDLRPEPAYNRFHIEDAQRADLRGLEGARERLLHLPTNTVIVLVDQQEERSTEAFALLTAMGVRNVYLLEDGVDGWLAAYGDDPMRPGAGPALGERWAASRPNAHEVHEREYTKKIKLVTKAKKSGGCG